MKVFVGPNRVGPVGGKGTSTLVEGKRRNQSNVPSVPVQQKHQPRKRVDTPETEVSNYDDSTVESFDFSSSCDDFDTVSSSKTSLNYTACAGPDKPNIHFDFVPGTSCELGIDTKKYDGSRSKIDSLPPSSSFIEAQSRPMKVARTRQKSFNIKKLKRNPHDIIISKHYDRKRIERNLESFYPFDENDKNSNESFSNRPLHESAERNPNETRPEMRRLDDIDARSDIFRFSLGAISISARSLGESFSGGNEKNISHFDGGYKGDKFTEHEEDYGDDLRSVNNAIATRNLISAPRLCDGTKNIPSIIKVHTPEKHADTLMSPPSEKNADTLIPLPSEKNTDTLMSPPSEMNEKSMCTSSPLKEELSVKSISERNKSVIIKEKTTDISLHGNSKRSSKSTNSVHSPVAVYQWSERRPWRKPASTNYRSLPPSHEKRYSMIDADEQSISQLRSTIQEISTKVLQNSSIRLDEKCQTISKTTPKKSSITTYSKKVNSIKSRLREIERARLPHLADEGMRTL